MERHQHAWYKFCPIWGRFGYMLLTNRSFSQQAWWFSVWNVPPSGTKRYPLPLIAFKFLSRVNIERQECCVNFCDFSRFVWTFLCISWVFNAFMCIIQMWTTCACSSAYKLVEKSNMCPWVHAEVPCKKWEWISNTGAPLIIGKTLRCLVLNSSKSKTRLKFMKLGILSWRDIYMRGINFVSFGAGLGICFLQTGASQNKHDGFW